MTPTANYNSSASFGDIVKAQTGHHNLGQTSDALLFFGNGDGGGGPTVDHLERLRRWRATSVEHDPKGAQSAVVRMGATLDDFFAKVRKDTDEGATLPNWVGELYLEIHRGTYTSQGESKAMLMTGLTSARTKKGNRDGEVAMRKIELLCTLASLGSDFAYPHDDIRLCWEALCLCHFHDTLPGSVIHRVADDLADKYTEFRQLSSQVLAKAETALFKQGGRTDLIINPTPFLERVEVVKAAGEYKLVGGNGVTGQLAKAEPSAVKGELTGSSRVNLSDQDLWRCRAK